MNPELQQFLQQVCEEIFQQIGSNGVEMQQPKSDTQKKEIHARTGGVFVMEKIVQQLHRKFQEELIFSIGQLRFLQHEHFRALQIPLGIELKMQELLEKHWENKSAKLNNSNLADLTLPNKIQRNGSLPEHAENKTATFPMNDNTAKLNGAIVSHSAPSVSTSPIPSSQVNAKAKDASTETPLQTPNNSTSKESSTQPHHTAATTEDHEPSNTLIQSRQSNSTSQVTRRQCVYCHKTEANGVAFTGRYLVRESNKERYLQHFQIQTLDEGPLCDYCYRSWNTANQKRKRKPQQALEETEQDEESSVPTKIRKTKLLSSNITNNSSALQSSSTSAFLPNNSSPNPASSIDTMSKQPFKKSIIASYTKQQQQQQQQQREQSPVTSEPATSPSQDKKEASDDEEDNDDEQGKTTNEDNIDDERNSMIEEPSEFPNQIDVRVRKFCQERDEDVSQFIIHNQCKVECITCTKAMGKPCILETANPHHIYSSVVRHIAGSAKAKQKRGIKHFRNKEILQQENELLHTKLI